MKIFGFTIKKQNLLEVIITIVALGYILTYLVLNRDRLIEGALDVFKAFF
ncbi:hypothetical protein [Prolixibacter sp. NT017]|nr:hypothetical protein [Prolixibacter sp. NT017]GET26831.1 hypothetical protein NT017_31600 [Prolixibacter sp. NT017]